MVSLFPSSGVFPDLLRVEARAELRGVGADAVERAADADLLGDPGRRERHVEGRRLASAEREGALLLGGEALAGRGELVGPGQRDVGDRVRAVRSVLAVRVTPVVGLVIVIVAPATARRSRR